LEENGALFMETQTLPAQTTSYARGVDNPPLTDLCIGQVLDRMAERHPESLALVLSQEHVRLSWRELHAEVERTARGLMALGFERGDRVGIWATNISQWVLMQFATAKSGVVLVNLNLRFRAHELDFVLKQATCKGLVMQHEFRDCNYVETLRHLAPELESCDPGQLHSERLPHLRQIVYIGENPPAGMLSWKAMLDEGERVTPAELRAREASLTCYDTINIQYTSGTTGTPKGAELSHYNVVNNGQFIGDSMKLTERDKVCIPVPFYHCFGMVLGNMACLTHGSAMVIPANYFDPLATMQTVHDERCTAIYGVPTMFIAELSHPRFHEFDFTSLRTGIMAGSLCPIDLMRRVIRDMHCGELTICYGLTEASPVITQTTTEDTLERKTTTVGRVLPHTEVKIIDPQTGQLVPLGENGELCTRGYLVMNRYHNDPDGTAATIEPDGWLHSGDLASIDEQGYVKITGRLKEMIIRGGENIYPREIEEFLYSYPGILDVQVIGVPSAKYGEEVMAWIIPQDGVTLDAEAIQAHCRAEIAGFKVPKYIKFVDSFPITVTGKVQKFIMRNMAIKEMGKA
jgi:fatty-acyl-CoA synthase